MLALIITAMIGSAVAGMLHAVSTGVQTRRDSRTMMVRANAAAGRVASYITPSRCFLDISTDALVLWLHDDRQSQTVHATEIRWIDYDAVNGEALVTFVCLPDEWSEVTRDLEDREYPLGTDWETVRSHYASNNWTCTMRIATGLDALAFLPDKADARAALHLLIDVTFSETDLVLAATIREHQTPES